MTLIENTVVRGTVRSLADGLALIALASDAPEEQELLGRVPLTEFGKPPLVAVGDSVEVLLEVLDAGKEPVLSKEKADQLRKWDRLVKAHASGELIDGTILAAVKGGFSVDIGLHGFLPGKPADSSLTRDPESLVGQTLQFKIRKLEDDLGRVVLTRREMVEKERAAQKEEREAQKKEALARVQEGAVLKGVVKTVTDYGAFVDLGGVDGLLHVTEMSWARVGHPREVVKIGDEVQVKVLKHDPATGRIGLGLKQTQPDPWATAAAQFPAGTKVSGKVQSLTDYGAFVAIGPGVEGLVHVSEMGWSRVTSPAKVLSVGQQIEAVVLELDPAAKRIRLSMRQLAPNPWTQLEEQYPIGSVIRVRVRSLTDFGVFVGVQEGIDGLIHVSDLSWTQRIKHPGELYKKGDDIEAVVLDIDAANERFSLGVKQLQKDPWSELAERHPIGSVTVGKVTRLVDFGAFVEIEPGIEGLVHISQLRDERVEHPRDVLKEGEEVSVKVIDLDTYARKIALSVKAAQHGADDLAAGGEYDYRETMKSLEKQGNASFGEVLAGKLKKKDE